MNWTALGDETVDVVRRSLSIGTTNPPGNETQGARFLAGDGGHLDGRGARHDTEMLLDVAAA